MTLATISETYGVPMDALYRMIGADETIPPETELKELEKLVPGTEVSELRANVAAYLEGTWAPGDGQEDSEIIPEGEVVPTAVPVEMTPAEPTVVPVDPSGSSPEEALTPESSDEHVPQGPGAGGQGQGSGDGAGAAIVLPEDGGPLPGSQIKGRKTLLEVVDLCQVPLEYLVAELELPEDVDTSLRMRDLAGQMGIEVLTVREVVERYQADH
jgi:hypothetical protein